MCATETKGTDAKTLLLDLLAVIPNGDKSTAFFAEDGVMELPFLLYRAACGRKGEDQAAP
jgi:hypothetical protein